MLDTQAYRGHGKSLFYSIKHVTLQNYGQWKLSPFVFSNGHLSIALKALSYHTLSRIEIHDKWYRNV